MKKILAALAATLFSVLATAQTVPTQNVLLAVDTGRNRVMTLDPQTGAVLNANFIVDNGSYSGAFTAAWAPSTPPARPTTATSRWCWAA